MLDRIPGRSELMELMGPGAYEAWEELCALIQQRYIMDTLWNKGGRGGVYEYKIRKGGKTLCALYPREGSFGFMVVLGQKERQAFEAQQERFSPQTVARYHECATYHDGKWLMVEVQGKGLIEDMEGLLLIKRRPNRK